MQTQNPKPKTQNPKKLIKDSVPLLFFSMILLLFLINSCKKEMRQNENRTEVKNNLSTILDSNAFPGMVDFVNASCSDTAHFTSINHIYAKECFNAYLNYMFIPQNTDSLLISHIDTFELNLSLHNNSGIYFIHKDTIRTFITALNTNINTEAISLTFNHNSNLDFISIQLDYVGDVVNNVIRTRVILYSGESGQLGACSFTGDFAAKDVTRVPISTDGSCYSITGQYYADKQIRALLNNPACNSDLNCTDILDLRPQKGDYTNGAYTTLRTKIAFSDYSINPPSDWTLWYSLFPNPRFQCISSAVMDTYYSYCKDMSETQRPTYTVPNTTTTINKSIDYYVYDTWLQDDNTIPSIPNGSYYHFCDIHYKVCVIIPIYPVASKNYDDWRKGL